MPPEPIRLWCGELQAMELPGEAIASWLSADERQRAARYRWARDRCRFERRRAWLRRILGWHLGLPPARVRLQYGAHGRPHLADDPDLHFSVADSGGRVIYALARGRRLGVDLEEVRADIDCEALARSWFAPAEAAALYALPPAARPAAFFRGWTRKEACAKARGEGVALPLAAAEVSLTDEPWTVTAGWAYLLLEPFAGCLASLALEGADRPAVALQWLGAS